MKKRTSGIDAALEICGLDRAVSAKALIFTVHLDIHGCDCASLLYARLPDNINRWDNVRSDISVVAFDERLQNGFCGLKQETPVQTSSK